MSTMAWKSTTTLGCLTTLLFLFVVLIGFGVVVFEALQTVILWVFRTVLR